MDHRTKSLSAKPSETVSTVRSAMNRHGAPRAASFPYQQITAYLYACFSSTGGGATRAQGNRIIFHECKRAHWSIMPCSFFGDIEHRVARVTVAHSRSMTCSMQHRGEKVMSGQDNNPSGLSTRRTNPNYRESKCF